MCVFSHLSHPWIFLHFGNSTEQTWWGRGWRDLQDTAEVGRVDGGFLRVKQGRQVFLPLGGKIQLLSCPGGGKGKKSLESKAILRKLPSCKVKQILFLSLSGNVFLRRYPTKRLLILNVYLDKNHTLTLT